MRSIPKAPFFLFIFFVRSVLADTAFQSLRIGVDARTSAMGMAGLAASGSGADFRNPACLVLNSGNHALFSWNRWIQGMKRGAFDISSAGNKQGLAFHIRYAEIGGIEHRIVPTPEPIGTFSWNEAAAGFSYGRKWNRFALGVSANALYEKIYIEDAWGVSMDIGALYQVPWRNLRIGAAFFNIGRTGKLKLQSMELPLTGKLGAALPFTLGGFDWLIAADAVFERDEPFHFHGGLEWGLVKSLYIRSGYQTGYDNRGVSFGTGVAWKGYRFDYGFMPFRSGLGDSHWLTFGIAW